MKVLIAFSVLTFVLAGCSKKEAASSEATAESSGATNEEGVIEPSTEAAAESAPEAAAVPNQEQITEGLEGISGSLEKQDYDSAVDNLAAISLAQKNEAQQQAYREQLFRAQEYLREKAQTDAKAREAYQKLGRAAMGR